MGQQVTDLATKLAGWKKSCPHPESRLFTDDSGEVHESQCICNGTGEVYVFDDSVRVPCGGCGSSPGLRGADNATYGTHHSPCYAGCTCEERGWIASPDLAVWLNAARNAGFLVSLRTTPSATMLTFECEIGSYLNPTVFWATPIVYDDNPQQALLTALEPALKEK